MKAIKTLLAVSVIAGAAGVQAATFNVSGSQTGVVMTSPPLPTTVSTTPAAPAFTGSWNVDVSVPSSPTFSGSVAFGNYVAHIDVNGWLNADLDYTAKNPGYTFVLGTGSSISYNMGSRQLTVTNATATYTGSAPTCTGAALICGSQPDGHFEDLDLILTFNTTLDAFSGTITASNDAGANGISVHSWTFSGTEVPLPAAAWLFGSGLIGLVGAARRRRASA